MTISVAETMRVRARSVARADIGWLVPKRAWRRLAAVAVTAALGVAAVAALVLQSLLGLPSGAALKVGGTVVTAQALQHRIDVLSALYGVDAPSGGAALDTFDRLAAKSEVLTLVIQNAARKDGITVSSSAANDSLNTLIQQDFPQGRQAFLNALSAKGVSQQDIINEVTLQLVTGELYDKVTAKVPAATKAAEQQAIKSRAATAFSPQERHIRNIVVKTRAQADQVLKLAGSGTSFAALAKQYSIDGSTKSSAGDIGTVAASQLDSGYSKAAFAAPDGGFFGPVQDRYGWNVGEIVGVQQPKQYPTAQIAANIASNDKDSVWNGWLTRQMKDAHARYAAKYEPPDPDSVSGAIGQ